MATKRGYHGSSVLSGSLTGMPFYHDNMDLPLPIVIRFDGPDYYLGHHEGENELEFSKRRAKELEELIIQNDPDTIGAFLQNLYKEPVVLFHHHKGILKRYKKYLVNMKYCWYVMRLLQVLEEQALYLVHLSMLLNPI